MKFKRVKMMLLVVICLFSCLLKDMHTIFATSEETLNQIEINSASSIYDSYNKRSIITVLCSDLVGLDYKRSTITLLNKNNEEEIISLYDGRVVEITNGNYTYGYYNTSGYISYLVENNTLRIYIASKESDSVNLEGSSATFNYELYLVNSVNSSDTYLGEFSNEYIDYKINSYDLSSSGVNVTLSFDFRNSINKKNNLSIYNAGTYKVNVTDYYGNLRNLDLVIDDNYDPGTNITFNKLSNGYEGVSVSISRVPYNIIVAEEFYDDIYITYDDIINKVDNDVVDLFNTSSYLDSNGLSRFNDSSVTINLKPGMQLIYKINSGEYEDYEYYTENSYLINEERSIEEYMEDYEYIATKEESIVVDIIDGSPVFEYIQIKNSNYAFNTDRLTVTQNNSFNVSVGVSKNTSFKYKYSNEHGDEVIKEIKVENMITPSPLVRFNVNLDSYNLDSSNNSYIYGDVTMYLEDNNFEYVYKSNGLPVSYTFSESNLNSYTIDKDDIKILYKGVATNLTLDNDIVVELPIDKLISLESKDNNDNQSDDNSDTSSLGVGVITLIVVSSSLVVSASIFSVIWFVIKKKTWNDLIKVFKR